MSESLKMLSLFSGIGGMDLAAQWAAIETVAFCEIEPFCQKVLRKNFGKDIIIYDDIRTLTTDSLRQSGIAPESISVVAGGFPCQDVSAANPTGAGTSGARSGLWYQMVRIICELRPRYVVVENVANLSNRGLPGVLGDLARIGYDAEWDCIRASEVGAPHRRRRIFIVAYPCDTRTERLVKGVYSGGNGQWGWRGEKDLRAIAAAPFERGNRWPQPLIRRMDDGRAGRVDRLKGLGNMVVPQQVYPAFEAITRYEEISQTQT